VTDQDLEQWAKLSAKATPGPWQPCGAQPEAVCACGLIWSIPFDRPVAAWHSEDGHSGRSQDVLFIAAARTAVPGLIDEVKKLRTEIERLSNVYAVASSLRMFPVPFDDHQRLMDAVDAARAEEISP
jgi:hypothetical protein